MIIKLEKVISCTSEHPSYPASNLLQQRTNSSWRCAKPGQLLASVIFQLAEASTITGLDIGNYRCCDVIVTASTSDEPDNWIPVVNHRFMSHEEAANGKFRDQVELFTKRELNADTIKIKFSRAKVTCVQSANLRELFGLSFFVLRTQVTLELGADIFGRFKLKDAPSKLAAPPAASKEVAAKRAPDKPAAYKESLAKEIKEEAARNFAKRQENPTARLAKRPILEKIKAEEEEEEEEEKEEKSSSQVARTPFGDVINSPPRDGAETKKKARGSKDEETQRARKMAADCRECSYNDRSRDSVCKKCGKLPPPDRLDSPPIKKPKIAAKPSKPFGKLFEDVTFALSGYVNPQRDQIRKKALRMGGKYVADPNTTDNKASHLVCAFKNTPKFRQLEGHTKIVSRSFIEECFKLKKRLPWRRFALDGKERTEPESEEEIEASTTPRKPPDPYQQDTDADSDY